MAYISFVALLFGMAGVAGGIETENMTGLVDAAVITIGGIIAMALAKRREEAEDGADLCDEDGQASGRGGIDHADSGAD
ncbi:MAG: hypothetical protein HDR06_12330 [Lachnospiraceae bacterium]|nr:hypothetical protein [Lachnospiraceae bacterium]